MTERYLTITLQPDWKGALRTIGQAAAKTDTYQGEVLNFESPGHFFGQLSEKRWEIVCAAQGKGELSVRELARAVGRDVKRVHQDVVVLLVWACWSAQRVAVWSAHIRPCKLLKKTPRNLTLIQIPTFVFRENQRTPRGSKALKPIPPSTRACHKSKTLLGLRQNTLSAWRTVRL